MITGAIEHLFMYLWTIYVSFLVKCLFMSFANLLVELFVFLKLSWMSFFLILDTIPLLETCMANTFSKVVVCIFPYLAAAVVIRSS